MLIQFEKLQKQFFKIVKWFYGLVNNLVHNHRTILAINPTFLTKYLPMLQKQILATFTFLFSTFFLFGQLQSPNEFLPHNLGEQFTGHDRLVDYFEHVAENSNLVTLESYGMTNQNRPLKLAFVTSKKNHANLEKIRLHNLSLAGMAKSDWQPKEPISIVWLTYSVHGNEPSGSECSMQVLYDLVNPKEQKTKAWLENTVVIIDPACNPDGYERYTHWFRNAKNAIPNPAWMSREHHEPWPGGRVNHYQFDLNRDWAWLTQKESRQRIEVYQQWLPHVHPDIHEQYPNNPYYFAPAAEPFHEYITDWQREFQTEIGKNHAHYFDEEGWMYFTREIFDLFYPSYGDTYPTFNGSIGMTYEQAGHSVGGTAVSLNNGDTLFLSDRIAHHYTTSLSTIEMTSKNAGRLIDNFSNYFNESLNQPQGKYKSFFIKNLPEDAAKIKRLTELLDFHQIEYSRISSATSVSAYDYQALREARVSLNSGDLVVSSYQPKSVLAQVLLEPEPTLSDSLTYDITSWALPYAYGLTAYASTQRFKGSVAVAASKTTVSNNHLNEKPYSLIANWKSVNDAAFLSDLLQNGIQVRFSKNAFTNDNQSFTAGSLIISRADNYNHSKWVAFAKKAASKHGIRLSSIQSGFSTTGKDIGSEDMQLISAPNLAVLYGDGVDVNSYGYIWHYLEQEAGYPFAAVRLNQLEKENLSKINTLILPEGGYKLSDDFLEKLNEWISSGGKLIALGGANAKLAGKEGFDLSKPESNGGMAPKPTPYAQSNRSHISDGTPGAIVKNEVDVTHPLAFGLGSEYFSLKTAATKYPKLEKGWNVVTVGNSVKKSGFIGSEFMKQLPGTLTFGVQQKGAGKVIYLIDDPLFRGFWYNGKLIFSNALFLN